MVLLINNFCGKDQLSQSYPDNVINNKESSDLPALNYFYNELQDSLQITINGLKETQKGQLIAFTNSLLKTINSELNYFGDTSNSSYDLMEKIFTEEVAGWRADILILRTVDVYLNLNMNVNDTPPALENPEKLLKRFQKLLPHSPITKIIENLVSSAESEKVEDTAFEDVIETNDSSYQHEVKAFSELNDDDNAFDLTQSPMDSIITHNPESYDQYESDEQNDQPKYPTEEMYYDAAVNYLTGVGYLSNGESLTKEGRNSLWTIGENYASVDGYYDNLTLQEHIENYNTRLQSGDIKYTGGEELVFITLT